MGDKVIEFETAVLAKHKGFNSQVMAHYRDGGHYEKEYIFGGSLYNMNCEEEQKQP